MSINLLPSRASAPDHCAECDGPRDQSGPLCAECSAASFLQRIDWRYQNGEGVVPLFDNDRWRIVREFHPLHWGLGVEFEFDHVSAAIAVRLGPLVLSIGWNS
jgi:hypothetical protein